MNIDKSNVKKGMLILSLLVLTVAVFSKSGSLIVSKNISGSIPVASAASVTLNEGDIVKTAYNPDVYIIKYKNNKQYKRLILSPSVFKSYGHLKWSNLKIVPQSQMDSYVTASLVQVAGDNNIYLLTPLGDTGRREIFDVTKPYDADSIYEINTVDRNSYRLNSGDLGATDPMPASAKTLFVHHSTGGGVWGGGVSNMISGYNKSHGTSYDVKELWYPANSGNNPYDYWNAWVKNGGNGETTLETLTQTYDVIAFKHCFPVSGIGADTGRPDVTSGSQTQENYKLQYNALKEKMHQFPDKRFIVWTGAALTRAATNQADATRAREFFTWVVNTWDEPGDNIYVWDFWQLETEGGIYLLPQYANGDDSHPNGAFNTRVAPLFGQRIIDVIEGRG